MIVKEYLFILQAFRDLKSSTIIKSGFSGLFMLLISGNFIYLPMMTQLRSGLMEVKWYAIFNALQMCIQHPAIITDPGIRSGLSATGYGFDFFAIL